VIDVPGTAEVVFTFQDDEVIEAQPLELNGCADPCESGPHDDRIEALRSHD
jgi:hypothetical protein